MVSRFHAGFFRICRRAVGCVCALWVLAVFCPGARAMFFYGGAGEGGDAASGYSRVWGMQGGNGRGEAGYLTASRTLLTFSSAAAQSFIVGDGATAMSLATIRQDTAVGGGVTAAGDLRVVIPADLDMVWDSTDTAAVIGGAAAGKVSGTVSYADSNKTLVLNVTSDFADGDEITVSGLSFKSFAAVGAEQLRLDISGAGEVYEPDFYDKSIAFTDRTAGYLGGDGRGEVSALLGERGPGFNGGNGRGEISVLTGSVTLMSFSSAAFQSFDYDDPATAASLMTITQDAAAGTGVTAASDLRVNIPVELGMTWDTTDTSAVIGGAAAGKVSGTVSYADSGRTLVLNVTSDFADGDTVTIDGVAFSGFTAAVLTRLGLDISGSGTLYEFDGYEKEVLMPARSAGFLGGDGCGESLALTGEGVLGYLGGDGRGEGSALTGSRTIMFFMSDAGQTFTYGDGATAMSQATIRQDVTVGSGVTAASDIRVNIPVELGMTWDTTDTSAVIGGAAAGKVSGTVSYADSGRTLVVNVTSDFVDGDEITLSGLAFTDFLYGGDYPLMLDVSGAGTVYEPDGYNKFVLMTQMAAGFLGGDGRGEALALAGERGTGYTGTSGRGEVLGLTGSVTLMTFTSAASQTFTYGDGATAMSQATIRQDTAVGTGVTAANDLRLNIPVELGMSWDTSDTSAVVGGAAAGKVSGTVSYADSGRTLVVNVTSDFADGDEITLSGLAFTDFLYAGDNQLMLDITGAGTVYEPDSYNKVVVITSRTAGYLGTSGRGEGQGEIFILPRNTVDFGTLF